MDKEKRNIQTLATTQSKYLSDILDVEDVKQFKSLIPELKDTWKKKQVFRTETEMRFSVLSDNKYPTRAAKYWQCVREQNTHFENLMHLSFDARKNDVEIEKIYSKASMELVAKHRMREVATWSKLKKEFHDGSFDDKDVNTHQAHSYKLRLEHQKATLTPGSSQPEVFNVLGQLNTLDRVMREGELLPNKEKKKIKRK